MAASSFRSLRTAFPATLLILAVLAASGALGRADDAPGAEAPTNAKPVSHLLLQYEQSLVFLGDTLTEQGTQHPYGYLQLTVGALGMALYRTNAGSAGTNSRTALARLQRDVLQRDVLEKKPDWVFICCGEVDACGPAALAVPLEEYRTNMRKLISRCQAARCRVLICTLPLVSNDPADPRGARLQPYNACLRQLAIERNCPVADLDAAMAAARTARADHSDSFFGCPLTEDGIRPNPCGNAVLAACMLRSLKVSPEWTDVQFKNFVDNIFLIDVEADQVVDAQHRLRVHGFLSILEYAKLTMIAAQHGITFPALLVKLRDLDLQELVLQPKGPYATPLQACESPTRTKLEADLAVCFRRQLNDLYMSRFPQAPARCQALLDALFPALPAASVAPGEAANH